MTLTRFPIPQPPPELFALDAVIKFEPTQDLNLFVGETVLNEDHPLYNPDHLHLTQADIGFLWTTTRNTRHMKLIAGEAEMPNFKGGSWQKARQEQQFELWFGAVPDFVITLDAGFRRELSDIAFLALLEHELYHCGQRTDEFGMPRFSQTTGLPIFGIRGHDVEEFTGVVRRYGIGATGQDKVDFIEAALTAPEIGEAKVSELCGTCGIG